MCIFLSELLSLTGYGSFYKTLGLLSNAVCKTKPGKLVVNANDTGQHNVKVSDCGCGVDGG